MEASPTPYLSAPAFQASDWLNTPHPLPLDRLRGRIVVVEVFQMLCPACVSHGLPQARLIADVFAGQGVTVLGLHSVFEHHEAMRPHALKAFLQEYQIRFPVMIDAPGHGGIPKTMQAYHLNGTPSLLIIDHNGFLRFSHFGRPSDMRVGAVIAQLLAEAACPIIDNAGAPPSVPLNRAQDCGPSGCRL